MEIFALAITVGWKLIIVFSPVIIMAGATIIREFINEEGLL